MKLILPDYDIKLGDGLAEVKNGILYIYKPGSFKDVMYQLTYLIYGKDECFFCHKKLRSNMLEMDNEKYFSQITLDHLIPQEFGGPTITNNLRPACSECNSSKGNMYPDEFLEYRKYYNKKRDKESKKARREFKESLRNTQEQRRKGEIESISKEWFTDELIRNIYVSFWIAEPLGAMYKKQERFLKKYKRLPKPIVVSQNRFLLDGFNTILLAKYNYGEQIKIIVLENVIFVGFP